LDNSVIAARNIRRVRQLLKERSLDALVVSLQHNFSWLTGGGNCHVGLATRDGAARLVITLDEAYLVANNIETPRLLAEEIDSTLFKSRVFNWYEGDFSDLVEELVAGRTIGSDTSVPGTVLLESELGILRSVLGPEERERLNTAGRLVGEALGQVCKELVPGDTEYELAGQLAGALFARELTPTVLLVAGDERVSRFRHPIPTNKEVEKYAMVACVARYKGVQAAATRLIHFGPLDDELKRKHQAIVQVDATLIGDSVPGRRLKDVLSSGIKIYEKMGFGEQWKLHHQGGIIGYWTRELIAKPNTDLKIEVNQAMAWNPSIAGTKSEDTILVTNDGPQIVTTTSQWPLIEVHTENGTFLRPDILIR
jgi:Xaa-Pro aminopeptidase